MFTQCTLQQYTSACGLIVNVKAVCKNGCVHTLNEGECVKVGVFERAFVFTHWMLGYFAYICLLNDM